MTTRALALLPLLLNWAHAVQNLQIVSPLQALTIWDHDGDSDNLTTSTPRARFLPRFRAGLEAEAEVRKGHTARPVVTSNEGEQKDWSRKAAAADERASRWQDRQAERAFDAAVRKVKDEQDAQAHRHKLSPKSNQYQFVGVIHPGTAAVGDDSVAGTTTTPAAAITWYARRKPPHSKWSLRLVHVNRAAILKDLFDKGKIDLMARYDNTGQTLDINKPLITRTYATRERSWKNLWNFSPVHYFTDSAGAYWRERRLRPGLYTDGEVVYEASYRYRDGRNGMHRYSTYEQLVNSKAVAPHVKARIQRRLREDAPDVVLEE